MREIFFPTNFPRIFGVQYFGQGFIGNLPIADISAPYTADIVSVGERIYKDDTWLITESDFNFNRCSIIRTYSSHKQSTLNKEFSLRVKEPSKVYVAYDEKGSSSIPSWLKRVFKRTGRRIKSNQGHEYQLYCLEMRQGTISFGGNGLGVQRPGQNYFVIVENLRHYNDVITRDVVDLRINQLKYSSDRMIQMFFNDMLIHNVGTDPLHSLILNDNQFIQNGYSILNVLSPNGVVFSPHIESITYQEVISGPVNTGNKIIIKYFELVDGQLIEREKEVDEIIPAQLQSLSLNQTTSELEFKTFEELVEDLNVGIIPFEPYIENFMPIPRQPGLGETFLDFTEQEPLINPDIIIYGNDFISLGLPTTLFWTTENSSRILLETREIDFKGHINLFPLITSSYQFTVEADEELVAKNYTVQVKTISDPDKVDLPKLELRVNKKIVEPGDVVTVSWLAENVTNLKLTNFPLSSLSGSMDLTIEENTEIILKGFNPNLEASIKLLIRVTDIKYTCCG